MFWPLSCKTIFPWLLSPHPLSFYLISLMLSLFFSFYILVTTVLGKFTFNLTSIHKCLYLGTMSTIDLMQQAELLQIIPMLK